LTQRQQTAFQLFRAGGYADNGAATIVGGDSQESGVNLVSGNQTTTDHGSQGIAQWRLERLTALEDFCAANHLSSGALASQVSFQIYELGKDYPLLDKRLRAGTETIDVLADALCFQYERPNRAAANLPNRIKQAKSILRDSKAVTLPQTGAIIAASAGAAALHQFAGAGKWMVIIIIGATIFTVALAALTRWLETHKNGTDALSAALQQMHASQAAVANSAQAAVAQVAAREKKIAADVTAVLAAKVAIGGVIPSQGPPGFPQGPSLDPAKAAIAAAFPPKAPVK
jgi:Phage tail lysozyme